MILIFSFIEYISIRGHHFHQIAWLVFLVGIVGMLGVQRKPQSDRKSNVVSLPSLVPTISTFGRQKALDANAALARMRRRATVGVFLDLGDRLDVRFRQWGPGKSHIAAGGHVAMGGFVHPSLLGPAGDEH